MTSLRSRVGHWSFGASLAAILVGSAGIARGQLVLPTPPEITNDSIVLLPDTQYYSDYDLDTFLAQTSWIADRSNPSRMRMVIGLGDVTNNNTFFEWLAATIAMSNLRGDTPIPFVMVPGNHDNPDSGEQRDTSNFNLFFPPTSFEGRNEWKSLDGTTSDNSIATFSASGRDFMVVNLEFAPRKQNLCRAQDEIRNHPNHAVIIATHCYQSHNGGWEDCTGRYGLVGSNGDTIWNELAKRHNNVQMIVSGHVTSSALTRRDRSSNIATLIGEGGRVPEGQVVEILTDFQFVRRPGPLPSLSGAKHGMGFMRTLSFAPGSDQVVLNTFTVLDPFTALTQLREYISTEAPADAFPGGYLPNRTFELPRTISGPFDPGPLLTVHDFTVNDGSGGQQLRPRIVGNGSGPYTVVWEDDSNNNGAYEVKGRGFRADGCQEVAQQTINLSSTGQQRKPAIATRQDGSTVVVWEDDQNGDRILAAGYGPTGIKVFGDIVVNRTTSGRQRLPDVDIDSLGNFVVVWQDDSSQQGWDIKGARFNAIGGRLPLDTTPDFLVNQAVAGNQHAPRIAMRRNGVTGQDGTFTVVWEDDSSDPGVFQIRAALFAANATKQPGGDRTINEFPEGQQRNPAIAMNSSGQFVVVWEDGRNPSNMLDIRMARFSAAGVKNPWPSGDRDQTVHMDVTDEQRRPQISMNAQGHFVVVWEDDRNQNNWFQIRSAGFDLTTGARIAVEQTVNFDSMGQQFAPDVLIADGTDQVVVVWQDDLDKNGFYEIVAKEFILGQIIETATTTASGVPPRYSLMDGPPWSAVVGGIDVDTRSTVGTRSIAFLPGFTEARPPGFGTGEWPAIGSKLLVDVFVPVQQPASNYKGAVQLYWGVPGAGQNHQFAGQRELSALAGGQWHVLEFDLPDEMRRLFLEKHKNAELSLAVNTDPGAPDRTLLDNLRFGGVLIPHPDAECDSADCLAICGPGKASCDGNTANGCETYLGTNRSHCGTCGHSCGAGLCVNSACEPAGARDISTTISFTSQSSTGYCADLSFTNHSLVPVAWEVVVDLRGATITSSWNGTWSGSQGVVSVSGVGWNNHIQPGASLHSLGFCAQRPVNGNLAAVEQTNTQFQ